jgi:hypothetical protein
MKSSREIQSIATMRLEEAELLFANGKVDGAFYLAGYAVELHFKAKICRLLQIDNFFPIALKYNFSKVYFTHNLDNLLMLSGLAAPYEDEKLTDPALMAAWTFIQKCAWSEEHRYSIPGTHSKSAVREFMDAIIVMSQWIQLH